MADEDQLVPFQVLGGFTTETLRTGRLRPPCIRVSVVTSCLEPDHRMADGESEHVNLN
jgi:hypothetical protein